MKGAGEATQESLEDSVAVYVTFCGCDEPNLQPSTRWVRKTITKPNIVAVVQLIGTLAI